MNAVLAPNVDAADAADATDDDRDAVVTCLTAALTALESDDQETWRANVDELIAWRTQPLVQGLARLAHELSAALGDRGSSGKDPLPEACERLEHVVRVTEEASHHTLDLIQECSALLGTLEAAESDARATTIAAIRSRFSEMTAAQGYQDLTGQIIRRVVVLVGAVHAGIGVHVSTEGPPLQIPSQGFGPSLPGIDAPAATQDDANQLLSSLGL